MGYSRRVGYLADPVDITIDGERLERPFTPFSARLAQW
jgi:hypothetical protein